MDQRLLDFWLQAQLLICVREAMIAENQERERHGLSQAYTERSFQDLSQSFANIIERMRNS